MVISTPDRVIFTSHYQAFIRDTGSTIPYEEYVINYEFTPKDKKDYLPFLSAFIRKRNQITRLLKDTYPANVVKSMKKQIALKRLPEEYLVFLREYPKQH